MRIKPRRKKRAAAVRVPCPPAVAPNDCWSMDFLSDRLASGQAFWVLALVDNVTSSNRQFNPIVHTTFGADAAPELGDYLVLVAMHVTTKEIPDWTWQTFWWTPDYQRDLRQENRSARA